MASTCSKEETSRRQLWVSRYKGVAEAFVLTFLFPPLVFVQAEKPAKAMVAYERALDWRELFDLAIREGTPEDDLVEMGLRVAGEKGVYSRSTLVLT